MTGSYNGPEGRYAVLYIEQDTKVGSEIFVA